MADSMREALVQAAIAAREQAYAKYSRFQVGAALLTDDRQIYSGCNVENSSYGLTICAERAAVFSAVAAGRRRFQLLAIATSGGASPCGACRQVLAEFAPELPIWLIDVNGPSQIVEVNLSELLPRPFLSERHV